MSDSENNYDSDHEEVSKEHSKLIDSVRQLDKGQRVKKPERSEPSLEVSEFHLVKSGITDQDAVKLEDLAKTLGTKGHHSELSKKINATKTRSQVLPKPLEKPAAERIKRTVGFENTKKELTKWNGIVARNRTAGCLSFPLSQTSMRLEATDEFLNRPRLQSELEKELAKLEPEKEPEEEKEEFPLTLAEILERRQEAAKFRAQQSYKESKARRQNKIKSKKYHRIQRKEKIKKALKEFEELQKTDPEAAKEKLDQLDKARAQERMTLRHKSTGQWAQNKLVRAKYDKETRQVLAEQLSISRELTQKVKKDDDSDDSDDQDQINPSTSNDTYNPWMKDLRNTKTESEVDEFIKGYRKYWDEQNKNSQSKTCENDSKFDENKKAKKKFEEPEIKNELEYRNPVATFIEEYLPGQIGSNDVDFCTSDESESETEHENSKNQKKKLEKVTKNKLGIKLPKSKLMKAKKLQVKAGTSDWSISPIDSPGSNELNGISDADEKQGIIRKKLPTSETQKVSKYSKDVDMDDLFDAVEDEKRREIEKKVSKYKRELKREEKREERMKKRRKQNRKNDPEDEVQKLGLKGQQKIKPIIDKPIEETADAQPSNDDSVTKKLSLITDLNNQLTLQAKARAQEIDPNKFISIKPKYINTLLPDEIAGEEDALDDKEEEEDQHQIISEAFADDDVVDDFRKEKEEEIKKSQPEDIDMRLPGWGSWGGKDIKLSMRKKKRFIMKFPKEAPRRDENKGDVVIIEEKNPKIKKHQVSELPHPYKNVADYEASLRAPSSREFVPEKVFSKIITPAVKVKMGKVIEPMSEDVLVRMGKREKRKKPVNGEKNDGKNKKMRVIRGKGAHTKRNKNE